MHSHLGAGVTTDRRQFILFYLFYFFLFFCILFPFLRFGSDFRSHDYHVYLYRKQYSGNKIL